MPHVVTLRPCNNADAAWIADLRAEVMRPDLERLQRFDPVWVRERFLRAYSAADTRLIDVNGETVGSVAVRVEPGERWVEHFYLASSHQGRGIGGEVLRRVLSESGESKAGKRGDGESGGDLPWRLNVLQGSPARRLYERHGFVFERADEIDVWLVRP